MKMEATCSSKTLVDFRQTTRRYVSEDRSLMEYLFIYLWLNKALSASRGSHSPEKLDDRMWLEAVVA
jgi:hypothetical protein